MFGVRAPVATQKSTPMVTIDERSIDCLSPTYLLACSLNKRTNEIIKKRLCLSEGGAIEQTFVFASFNLRLPSSSNILSSC